MYIEFLTSWFFIFFICVFRIYVTKIKESVIFFIETRINYIFINNSRKEVRDQTFVDHTDNLFHINQPREFENYSTENNYDSKEIFRVVHSLPRDYRIPFLMHLSGFKYREIADRLGLPLGTVKSRIFFTRQQLQRLLKDYR